MQKIIAVVLAGIALGPNSFRLSAAESTTPTSSRWANPAVEEVFPGVWRFRFGTPEKFTPDTVREAAPRAQGFNNLPAAGVAPFAPGQIRCRISSSRTTVYLPFEEAGNKIYGFGLDPESYQQNGLCKNLTVCSTSVGKTGASHGPVPFYLSTKGYGVYVDTARVPTVQVARLSNKETGLVEDIKSSQPGTFEAQLYAARVNAGKKDVIFDLPGDSTGVDVYVFGGPTMREAVERYNLFSGGGAVPPLWGLGLKFRTYTKADEASVLKAAHALRSMNIPCDMIGLEPGWQSASYSCSFTWSKERFPEPDRMIRELQDAGFKINLWEHAYVHPTSPMFNQLKPMAGEFLVWGGLVVDFINPRASKIFADYHDRELVSKGILGFKGDECDKQPAYDATPFNYPYSTEFPSGIDGDQMTQLYGYLYQKSLLMPFKAHNLRTWGDVRATSALAAPLPFNLYSDAYSFEQYLRQLVNASFAGLSWSPEVRQAGTLNGLLNRLAMSSFAPQMCLDMWFMPNPVWEQFDRVKNEKGQLLSDPERNAMAERLRAIVNRRYELLPYLYSSFQKYHTEGLPPVRSLMLDFPDDRRVWEVDDAYMFGDSLLVAPFLGESATRKVILPKGVDWFELNTHAWHNGGTTITVNGVPGEMPLFVRNNSLLPFAEPVQLVDGTTVFRITATAYGDAPASFTLFEDDGTTYDFESGAQSRVVLDWSGGKTGKVTRTGNFPKQRYDIVKWESVPGPK